MLRDIQPEYYSTEVYIWVKTEEGKLPYISFIHRRLRGRRTYLSARTKNDVSRHENKERRISAFLQPVHGQYKAKSGEIRRSSTTRRNTFFFLSAVDILSRFQYVKGSRDWYAAERHVVKASLSRGALLRFCLLPLSGASTATLPNTLEPRGYV